MDNYTIRLILWKHNANKKGLYPIYLKTTINRKTTYKSTGYYASKKDWDGKNERLKQGYANYTLINAKLTNLKNDWEHKIISNQLKGLSVSASSIKQSFKKDLTNIFD